jgi:cell division septal protein FtsQ
MSGRAGLRRWLWSLAAALGVAAVVVAVMYAPRVLRQLDAFTIERVEVTGTRFTEPWAVVRAAGIDERSNLFDDADAWLAGVLELPLVREARVRRTLPGTLTLEVREAEPVALVAEQELRAVDAAGRALELDLAGAVLDLPVLVGVALEHDALAGAALSAVELVNLMAAHDAALAERVSQVELIPGALRVVFRGQGPDALLPVQATPTHLMQLRLAYSDLASRGELSRVGRIDIRFRDQVVVSFLRTSVSSR